jgi:hypothetical protein
MKRLLGPASVLLALSACATGGGGGGGGAAYVDCHTDYCVEYQDDGLQRLYLRTPGAPAATARGNVTTADGRGGTRVVTREPAAAASASARMSPVPSTRHPAAPGFGGRRP